MPAQVCAPGEPPLFTSCTDQILIMMFLDREGDELRSPTTILRSAVAVRPVQLKRGLLPAMGISLSHRRGSVSQVIWRTFRIQKVPDVLSLTTRWPVHIQYPLTILPSDCDQSDFVFPVFLSALSGNPWP